jgi:hypothetical protein
MKQIKGIHASLSSNFLFSAIICSNMFFTAAERYIRRIRFRPGNAPQERKTLCLTGPSHGPTGDHPCDDAYGRQSHVRDTSPADGTVASCQSGPP